MAERRRGPTLRQRRVRWLLLGACVLVYVPLVHYWRTRHTTNAVLTQVSEVNRQTMAVFATRVPPAVRALRLEATLAGGLVGDTVGVNTAVSRLRAMAHGDGLGDTSVAIVL